MVPRALSTPVGWRRRTQAGRPIGELVVDPGVIAQLDIAAVAA